MYESISNTISDVLGPDVDPIAVFFVPDGTHDAALEAFDELRGHRWCQALMRARRGRSVRIDGAGLACPAAAAAFGFRPLPDNLANGKGLVGFGIVSDPATGRRMFEGMTRLAPGEVAWLAACPLREAPRLPDVVVVEGPTEALMWLALADLNLKGGDRVRTDTAVLQASCVDATVIPYRERRLNFGLGCYGCREATDLGPGETLLGFPGDRLDALIGALRQLGAQAIPRARARTAFSRLAGVQDA